jgi:very-short-patch-repair endonuclease
MRGPQPKKTGRARELRANTTRAEAMVWRYLRNRGLDGHKFVRQEPVGRYYVDFLCREKKIIVEIDGSQHADSASDRVRDAYLAAHGYRVIRIWNNEALQNIEGVFEMLTAEMRK